MASALFTALSPIGQAMLARAALLGACNGWVVLQAIFFCILIYSIKMRLLLMRRVVRWLLSPSTLYACLPARMGIILQRPPA
jgi:hypothetical protein